MIYGLKYPWTTFPLPLEYRCITLMVFQRYSKGISRVFQPLFHSYLIIIVLSPYYIDSIAPDLTAPDESIIVFMAIL